MNGIKKIKKEYFRYLDRYAQSSYYYDLYEEDIFTLLDRIEKETEKNKIKECEYIDKIRFIINYYTKEFAPDKPESLSGADLYQMQARIYQKLEDVFEMVKNNFTLKLENLQRSQNILLGSLTEKQQKEFSEAIMKDYAISDTDWTAIVSELPVDTVLDMDRDGYIELAVFPYTPSCKTTYMGIRHTRYKDLSDHDKIGVYLYKKYIDEIRTLS